MTSRTKFVLGVVLGLLLSLGGATFAELRATSGAFGPAAITGGSIDNTPIGATTPSSGSFTNVNVTGATPPSNGVYLQGANSPGVSANGAGVWRWSSTGSYVAVVDNSVDIGASGAVRPRDIFAARTVQIGQAVAVTAGGATTGFIGISSTAALGIYCGSGVPTISAAQGSLYIRTDGSSVSTRLYVNTNGTTGWTNVTTAT